MYICDHNLTMLDLFTLQRAVSVLLCEESEDWLSGWESLYADRLILQSIHSMPCNGTVSTKANAMLNRRVLA